MNTQNKDQETTVDVTLRIYHANLQPMEVTRLLGVSPTKSHCKGEVRERHGLKLPPTPSGGWFLSSQARGITSENLEDHLNWLVSILQPSQATIGNLLKKGYKITIACNTTMKRLTKVRSVRTDNQISPSTLKGLANLNVPLELSVAAVVPPVTSIRKRDQSANLHPTHDIEDD